MPFRRRRPLLRAAAVGGVAYAAGKHGAQAGQEADPNAPADEQPQAAVDPAPAASSADQSMEELTKLKEAPRQRRAHAGRIRRAEAEDPSEHVGLGHMARPLDSSRLAAASEPRVPDDLQLTSRRLEVLGPTNPRTDGWRRTCPLCFSMGTGSRAPTCSRSRGRSLPPSPVFVPDLPGFGRSEHPHTPLGIADLASALADLLDAAGLAVSRVRRELDGLSGRHGARRPSAGTRRTDRPHRANRRSAAALRAAPATRRAP